MLRRSLRPLFKFMHDRRTESASKDRFNGAADSLWKWLSHYYALINDEHSERWRHRFYLFEYERPKWERKAPIATEAAAVLRIFISTLVWIDRKMKNGCSATGNAPSTAQPRSKRTKISSSPPRSLQMPHICSSASEIVFKSERRRNRFRIEAPHFLPRKKWGICWKKSVCTSFETCFAGEKGYCSHKVISFGRKDCVWGKN